MKYIEIQNKTQFRTLARNKRIYARLHEDATIPVRVCLSDAIVALELAIENNGVMVVGVIDNFIYI